MTIGCAAAFRAGALSLPCVRARFIRVFWRISRANSVPLLRGQILFPLLRAIRSVCLFWHLFRFEIAIHIFLVAFRTIAVGKPRFGMNFDVVFDTLPMVRSVPDLFATATNRQ